MKNISCLGLLIALLLPATGRAQYHSYNVSSGSDCIMQDYRSPNVPPGIYDAIHEENVTSSDGGSGYFYGGFVHHQSSSYTLVQYVCWPASGGFAPYSQQIPVFAGTNMSGYAQIGEGSSCAIKGSWPLFTTNLWTREAVRYWQPADGTQHLGYQGMWMKEPVSGNWYHLGTFLYPFAVTGVKGMSGWQEDYLSYTGDFIVNHAAGYYHKSGAWNSANNITFTGGGHPSNCKLINGGTAAESDCGPDYTNNVPITLTLTQPSLPTFDPIVVTNPAANVYGSQLLVQWDLPLSSSPQLGYQINVYTNSGYTGTPVLNYTNLDPEVRQQLLTLTNVSTPYVKLTISDIFFNSTNILLGAPVTATLNNATNVTGTVGGLAYQYYESTSGDWTSLPNFNPLTPVQQGVVGFPDVTPRQQRSDYAFNYSGYLNAPSNGLYLFTVHSGDGSKLTVDGTTVINLDGLHDSSQFKGGGVALAAGKHNFNLKYYQGALDGHYRDGLGLAWEGPGIARADIPAAAFARVPAGGEPVITLTSPTNNATLPCFSPGLAASVTANGATVNSVQFYLTSFSSYYPRPGQGDFCVGQDAAAPYTFNSMVWSAPTNLVRARLVYNGTNTIDSAPVSIATTNGTTGAWYWTPLEMHNYPSGANIQGGTFSMVGDGMDMLSRQVAGDCTLIAHLAGITPNVAGPDGVSPDGSWRAGIILRGNTNTTIGTPLGNGSGTRFAALFSTVGGGTYFEDDTMRNGNGDANAWSGNLGGGNQWYKLQRNGDTFYSYVSADGMSWTQVNSNTLSNIGTTIYAGVFINALQSMNPNVHRASFDSYSLTGTNVIGPSSVSISPLTNVVVGGLPAAFTASVVGLVPSVYQWQLNGTNIANATNINYAIASAAATDVGNYTVVANSVTSAPAILLVTAPPAGSGVWTNVSGGSWIVAGNWSGGLIASGADAFADFSTLSLSASPTVSLNGARTNGTLVFDDLNPTNKHGWTLANGSSGPLTLATSSGTPNFVVKNGSNNISAVVAGTQGFNKVGTGYLTLSGAGTFTGTVNVNAGTLEVQSKSGDTSYTVAPGATLKIGYSTGGSYANTAMTINGNGAAAANGFYLKGGKNYNSSGKITLNYAPTTIRQYGSGLASIGVFDNSGVGLWCAAAASGSVIDPNIQMVSDGYGMTVQVDAGTYTATGDLALNGPLNVGSSGFFKRGNGSLVLNSAATSANTALQLQGGSVICGAVNCIGVNASVPISSGATLALNGFDQTVASLNAAAGSTVSCGTNTLTVNTSPVLAGTLQMAISKGAALAGGQLLVSSGTLTAGGALVVNNSGPNALAAGDSFDLFNAASLAGSFTSVVLPDLSFWLQWNTNSLAVNGTITVTNAPADVWTGGSSVSGNWSNASNWGGAAPNANGDNLVFAGSVRPQNTNDYIVSCGWLELDPDTAFTLSGNALTLTAGLINSAQNNTMNLAVTLGASQTISVATGTSLTISNLLFGGNYTITALGGGTLILNGSSVNLANLGATTLDATELNAFTYNNSAGTLNGTVATSGTTGTIYLGTNVSVTGATFGVGLNGPGGSGTAQTDYFYLGQTNVINAGTIDVGYNAAATGNAYLQFGSGLNSPSLVIRGSSGGTSRANLNVGYITSSDYANGQGTLDLTSGVNGSTLDAMLGTVVIGCRTSGAGNYANTGTGTLVFDTGILDATSIVLGQADTKNKTGIGVLTVNGGTIKVQTLKLGNLTTTVSAGAVAANGTLNANAGSTIAAGTICSGAGTGTRTITWNGATLANYDASTDLLVSNLMVTLSGGCTNTLWPGVGRTVVFTNNAALAGVGGFTLTGAGTVRLFGTNTYGGSTTINAGTLALGSAGSISSSPLITVANGALFDVSAVSGFTIGAAQKLQGFGSVRGSTTVAGTLAPGGSIGTLTFSNNLILAGTTIMEIARTNGVATNDQAVVVGTVTYGGALVVTNIGTNSLQWGDTFKLFSAGARASSFASTNLPPLAAPLYWTNKLSVDGSIAVATTVNTTPTSLVAGVNGTNLNLSWPADRTGWRLLVQTNPLGTGLGTNWFTWPNSTNLNSASVFINQTNATVFFRLVYP